MRIPVVLTTLGLVILSLVGGDKGSTCSTTARLTSPVLIGLTSARETTRPALFEHLHRPDEMR